MTLHRVKTIRERLSELDRRERIKTLLEHYQDVVEGMQDTERGTCSGGCSLAPGDRWLCEAHGCANQGVIGAMCRAWNHRSYRELERLRVLIREERGELYAALAATYFHSTTRRMRRCTHGTEQGRRCSFSKTPEEYRAASKQIVHRHRGQPYALQEVLERVTAPVDARMLEGALVWLDLNWRGDPEIPDDLLGVNAADFLGVRAA